MYIKNRYGNQLNKKQRKPQPPYWRVTNMLARLRLKSKERDKGTSRFHITVPDFGIVFRFNPRDMMPNYSTWDIVDVDLDQLALNDIPFGQNLMWLLVSKGYMAHLRNGESGDSKLFKYFLIESGWALRIIAKRLELYNGEARHAFMIKRNTRLRDMSIHYILNHHPDFFDYLC